MVFFIIECVWLCQRVKSFPSPIVSFWSSSSLTWVVLIVSAGDVLPALNVITSLPAKVILVLSSASPLIESSAIVPTFVMFKSLNDKPVGEKVRTLVSN